MIVTADLIYNEPRQVAVPISGTSTEICPSRAGQKPRIAWIVTQTTGGVTASLAMSGSPAVLNAGPTFSSLQPFGESANTVEDALKIVWQGPIQAVGSGAGNMAVTERFAP
jgi:hypothetical protein